MHTHPPRVIGINGILSDGKTNTDHAIAMLRHRGFTVRDPGFKKVNPFSARWRGKAIAEQIADWYEPGDILLAHSFGCYIAAHVMAINPYAGAYLIAPAMSQHWEFSEAICPSTNIHAFHSKSDKWIRRGSMMLLHPFGNAGRYGFADPTVTNIEMVATHSSYFRPPLINNIVDLIVANHPVAKAEHSH